MTEILLYDYTSLEDDGWFGSYEVFHCIGSGNLTAQAVQQVISASNGDDLLVRINSIGGSVFDGFAIYNALKLHSGKVTVRIEGLAASIASIITMAGEEIIICQAAMMMIHKPTIDPFWCGSMDSDDLQREADALKQIEAVLNDIYVTRTGLGSTKIQNLIDAETWITPDMAVTLGFANKIEKTITEQPEIVQPVFNHLFKNANQNIRAYANNAFKIKNMSTQNDAIVNAVAENTKKVNSVLDWFKNNFKFGDKEPKAAQNASATLSDGNAIYYPDGDEFASGTQVYSDADMSKPMADGDYDLADNTKISVKDGLLETVTEAEVAPTDSAKEIADLKAELEIKNKALNEANTSLGTANETLERLKNMKSSYTPPPAKPTFEKPEQEAAKTETASAIEEAQARRKERQAKK